MRTLALGVALAAASARAAGGPELDYTLEAESQTRFFEAFDGDGTSLVRKTYYSVGGGFVVDEVAAGADRIVEDATVLAHPFRTGAELLARCRETGRSIAQVMAANERAWRTDAELRAALLHIWDVMQECVENGCTRADRTLPAWGP